MKKIISIVFLLFSFYIFSLVPTGNAESSTTKYVVTNKEEELSKKLADLENEIRMQSLIQYIEFESEVIIPEYIDFKYVEYIYNIADTLDIPIRTAFRLVYKESCFRDTVVSKVGAEGLMQLMPDTRRYYYDVLRVDTLKNLDKNQEDIYIGLNMVKDLHGFWHERGNSEKYTWKLTLASYNAGKGTVLHYKGIPPIKETTDFLAFILKEHSNPIFFANYIRKYEDQIKDNS